MERILLGQKIKMPLAYTICLAMCGNGVRIGKETIQQNRLVLTHRDPLRGRLAFCVVARGATMPSAVAFRTVITAPQTSATTASGSVSSSVHLKNKKALCQEFY